MSAKKLLLLLLALPLLFPSLSIAQLSVSATIPAQASDYEIALERVTAGTQFGPNEEIEYKVTYGATLSFATNIKVEAQWYPGISDDTTVSSDILDYVSGSATNGYSNTAPVIDTVNHKISWTINGFPGNTTGQEVSFKLITNTAYQGDKTLNFKVAARLYAPGVITDDVEDIAIYSNPPPPSSPTPSPSSTSTSTTTTTTAPIVLKIEKVEIRSITDSTARIFTQTNNNSKITFLYGKTLANLNQVIKSSTFKRTNNFNLEDLTPNTSYFFKFIATDEAGKTIYSDLYTFKTARESSPIEVLPQSLIVTSNDTIISNFHGRNEKGLDFLVIPESTVFQIKFSLKQKTSPLRVQALVREKNVLGINFPQAETSSEIAEMVEVEPGVYAGKLKTKKPGLYEIYARIYDAKGNITEQKISDLKVIGKFKIYTKDNSPIEGARIELSLFSKSKNKYVLIPSSSLTSGNPVFSNSKGEVDIVLPQGDYKAFISSLYFRDQDVKFRIGTGEKDGFPIVLMDKEGLTIFKIIGYYSRSANEVFVTNTQSYTKALTGSIRFFDLVSALILLSLVLLALIAFSKKHRIPLSSLSSYFFYLVDRKGRSEKYITGVVFDQDNNPIPMANVYLTDESDEAIIASTKTNIKGEFFFKRGKSKYLVLVMKKGFEATPPLKYEDREHVKFKVNLKKTDSIFNIADHLDHLLTGILGTSFEVILLVSLAFELLFINSFGVGKALPFLLISLFNFLLWTLHLRHRHNS